jgi:hypothetical protein
MFILQSDSKKNLQQKNTGSEKVVGNFAEKLFLGKQNGYKRLNCVRAIAEPTAKNLFRSFHLRM